MNKADVAEKIQGAIGLTKKESAELMEAVFSIMKSTLESGETLKIFGFGSFTVKQKNDRRGRNPQTGDKITIEARRVLTFKPSTLLRQAINGSAEYPRRLFHEDGPAWTGQDDIKQAPKAGIRLG